MLPTPPYMLSRQNIEQGLTPDNFNLVDNWLGKYFARFLLQRIMGVYEVELPKAGNITYQDWAYNYFWYCLFQYGYFVIFNTSQFGVIMQQCNPGGFNIFYNPYYVMVTNPLLDDHKEMRLFINRDCVLVKMTPDFAGLTDLINYYAGLLAVVGQTTVTNLMNSKLSYIFAASKRAEAETAKKMFERISRGDLAVVVDKKLFDDQGQPTWQLFEQNVGGNFIADRLLDAWQTIENKFATDIGLPNANTTKRERLITDEVNANNVATAAMAGVWLKNIQEGFEKANKMFGLSLKIDWKYKPEVVENDRGDNNPKGNAGRAANAV